MEEYNDMGSNVLIVYHMFDMTDATKTTMREPKQEVWRQNLQIIGQSELKTKKKRYGEL